MAGGSWNVRSIAEDSEWSAGSACEPRKKSTNKVNLVKTQERRRGYAEAVNESWC